MTKWTDINVSLQAHPITGDVAKKRDIDAIHQQIRNLMLMDDGELPFEFGVGAGIRSLQFEQFDPITRDTLEAIIERNFTENVVRSDLVSVNVQFNPSERSLWIDIVHRPKNMDQEVEFRVILKKVR